MDCEDEKDRFDGTDGTASTKSVEENPTEGHPVKEKKERDMSNRPGKYDTMSVEGTPVFHPTDDSKVPGRIIERKSVKMAVAYHSVISTVKLHGMSCWRYLGEFFKKTVQTSEKKTCFQFSERSLSYAKTVQTSEKKTCFQFSECSLSYAKIFNGCRDFFSLTPANIDMAYAKYRANEYKAKLACLY